jgi:F0F1-type ATP synthase assembly protein I
MVKFITTSKLGLASSARSVSDHTPVAGDASQRSQFASAAIGMGWQLAVVVLIPIVGGYKLDVLLDSVPVWTLVGLIVAMAGSILVIRRALAAFGNFSLPIDETGANSAVAEKGSSPISGTAKNTQSDDKARGKHS